MFHDLILGQAKIKNVSGPPAWSNFYQVITQTDKKSVKDITTGKHTHTVKNALTYSTYKTGKIKVINHSKLEVETISGFEIRIYVIKIDLPFIR